MGKMNCCKAGLWVPTSSEEPKIYKSVHEHKYPQDRSIVQRQSSSCTSVLCTLCSARSERAHHTTPQSLSWNTCSFWSWCDLGTRYEMLGSTKQNIGNRSVCEIYRTLGLRASSLPFLGILGLTLLKWKLGKTRSEVFFVDPATAAQSWIFTSKRD